MDGLDFNSLVLEVMPDHKLLAAKDGTPSAIRGRTALKLG